MRAVAATEASPAELAKQMGRDCAGVQQDLGIRLQAYRNGPEDERGENFGMLELQDSRQPAQCKVSYFLRLQNTVSQHDI